MSSRKRTRPEDDSDTNRTTPPVVPRVLASRELFFSIPLRSTAVHAEPISPRSIPVDSADHLRANTRLSDPATLLNGLQRSSLIAVLAVLNDYFPEDETTRCLTEFVTDTTETDDAALASLADQIDLGLIAFLAKRGGQSNTPEADTPSPAPVPDTTPTPPAPGSNNSNSSTTAVPSKRARVSKKSCRSGRSSRSQKIRAACKTRDERCRLCKGAIGFSAHILPFSLQGRKTMHFWSFVAMFKGVEATAKLKAAALDPEPNNPDNIMNVIFLCPNCHTFLDKPLVSLIPQILESPASVFPYDPQTVEHYDAVVEFPGGLEDAIISVLQDDHEVKRMRPGHVLALRTTDPVNLPLPHPLLLQLHAICSRMVAMRAAAGYPVLKDDDSDGDTVYDALRVWEDDGAESKECFGEFGGEDVSRDPAVVMLELQDRRHEQEQLLQKLRGMGGGLSVCKLVQG